MNWNDLLSATDSVSRMRSVSELGGAVIIIFIVLMVGTLPLTDVMVRRAQVSEALSLIGTQRVEMAIEHAHSGTWSSSRDSVRGGFSTDFSGSYVKGVDWSDGRLAVEMRTTLETGKSEALHFRLATNSLDPSAPMLLVCGDWQTPIGFETRPGPTTNISPKYLPHICRDLTTTFVP